MRWIHYNYIYKLCPHTTGVVNILLRRQGALHSRGQGHLIYVHIPINPLPRYPSDYNTGANANTQTFTVKLFKLIVIVWFCSFILNFVLSCCCRFLYTCTLPFRNEIIIWLAAVQSFSFIRNIFVFLYKLSRTILC